MKASHIPAIVDALFLFYQGQLGVRCPCGFVVTGVSLVAVEEAMREHVTYLHLPTAAALAHAKGDLLTP